MSLISRFFGFIRSLFEQARPGLESFLKSNLPVAKQLIREYAAAHADEKYVEYKPALFLALRAAVPSLIPDTFISLALDWAYEHLRAAGGFKHPDAAHGDVELLL